ncbi:MAG: LysR family transcriptional regulator [Pseudorhodobacter sp.]
MELKLLEDFLCVADIRNFSRAAEMRHITQSTLSKRIRSLEDWVGAPLIDRSSYPVTLTPEGRLMIQQAHDLVQQFNNLRICIRGLAVKQTRDEVNILAMHTLHVSFLPGWIKQIEAKIGAFSELPLSANASYRETIRMFCNNESDLLVTFVHPTVTFGMDPQDLDCIILGHERVLPVSVPDQHGLPLHNLDSGEAVRFLNYSSQSFFAQVLTPLLREKPIALNVVATNALSVGLHSLALIGSGLAWVPESLARQDLLDGRLVLAGNPDWFIDVSIAIYRKASNRRPIVEDIWTAAQELAQANIHELTPDPDRAEGADPKRRILV